MTKSGRRTMGISDRLKRRIQSRGTRGNIIKSLAELIKNADDAYDRLDEYRDITPGTIEVAYDQLKVGKGFSIKGFIVRDFASGMSTERMEQVYHSKEGDTEGNYGKDTSDETRNGAIGVGGKDCFFELEECFILSVCDGVLTVAGIYTDKQGLGSEILTGNDAEKVVVAQFASNVKQWSKDHGRNIFIHKSRPEESVHVAVGVEFFGTTDFLNTYS